MPNSFDDRVIALAGIVQAAVLVNQLATTGHLSNSDLHNVVHSLFLQTPEKTLDVYGSLKTLEAGLTMLSNALKRNASAQQNDVIRYSMGIMHLQKKLSKRSDMLDVISSRLQQCQRQAEHFEPTHDNIIANLADIYTETISTFSFRIQVKGEYNYLQQSRVANQIRVILFSGIRSAVLWRQLGGNRLQALLQRKAMLNTCLLYTSPSPRDRG